MLWALSREQAQNRACALDGEDHLCRALRG
jgi:hypothetical protein